MKNENSRVENKTNYSLEEVQFIGLHIGDYNNCLQKYKQSLNEGSRYDQKCKRNLLNVKVAECEKHLPPSLVSFLGIERIQSDRV